MDEDPTRPAIGRVVLGLDGTAGSRHARRWCIETLQPSTQIVAVHAIPPLVELELSIPPLDSEAYVQGRTRHLVGEWCQPLRDAGFHVDCTLLEDNPVHGLLRLCRQREADLLVVGPHSHGGFIDRAFGGVAVRLVQQSTIPVVTVPPEAGGEAREETG